MDWRTWRLADEWRLVHQHKADVKNSKGVNNNNNNNNMIRTNHIRARIDKTQQNSKCSLCGD